MRGDNFEENNFFVFDLFIYKHNKKCWNNRGGNLNFRIKLRSKTSFNLCNELKEYTIKKVQPTS